MRNFLYHSLIISTAEHEAHYVIDGLMHNDVIKSEIHSTDTGGYSEILMICSSDVFHWITSAFGGNQAQINAPGSLPLNSMECGAFKQV